MGLLVFSLYKYHLIALYIYIFLLEFIFVDLRSDCHGLDLPANVKIMIPHYNDPFDNENEAYFQQAGAPPTFMPMSEIVSIAYVIRYGKHEEDVLRCSSFDFPIEPP